MKNRQIYRVLFVICGIFFFSCEEHSHNDHAQRPGKDSAGDEMENMPGMDHADHKTVDHSGMILLTPREQLLAGIKTGTVHFSDFRQSVTALGIVDMDESTVSVITAKVRGRIDRLYVRNPGEDVRSGQPLYDLYSETLLAEEQDLVYLVQHNASQELTGAARQKLKLHGLTENQVSEIEKKKSVSPAVTIYSTAAGYLSALPAREGQYVETGDIIFEIASRDVVRVNAQVYPGEITAFNKAAAYIVSASGREYNAAKLYGNPALESGSKILYVRLRVENKQHLLRPGMMTTVKAVSGSARLLTVPKESVLSEDGMFFTWVQEPDGMFSRRMLHTGKENESGIEVTDGLHEGEHVVTSGIYLLNSEYILRKGANSMGGMKM